MPSKVLVPRPISSRIDQAARRQVARGCWPSRVISTMNVDSPPARLSLAPTRVKMRSTTPISASRRRHEAAHLRQQRDQRHLAQVGGLARHVRAGEDEDLRVVGVERARRSGRSGSAAHRLDHRVAARRDAQRRLARRARGRDVAAPVRRLGERGERRRASPARRAVRGERRLCAPRRRRAAPRTDAARARRRRSSAPSTRASYSFSAGVTKRSAPTSVCLRS